MLNIYDILNVISPNYEIIKQNINIKKNYIETLEITNFDSSLSFTTFFSCLLYEYENINLEIINNNVQINPDILKNEIDKLHIFMDKYEFNPLINIKKMSNLILQNIINNELILLLSGYFNLNIYIYSYDTELLKIFYLEDKLYTKKKSVILITKKDKYNPNIGYQTLLNKQILSYNDLIIQNLLKDIYIIPIGIKENKKFEISDVKLEINFIISLKETKFEITDDIFNDLIILEDDDNNNNYFLELKTKYKKLKINKIINTFSKKNLMTEIDKYIIN